MNSKTYSIYLENDCCVSGLSFKEAIAWIDSKAGSNLVFEICEDDGLINE